MIAIPNMEKPKRCEKCSFRTCFIKVNIKKYTCWLNGEECGKTDCPLIEVSDEIWEALKPKVEAMSLAERGWIADDSNT